MGVCRLLKSPVWSEVPLNEWLDTVSIVWLIQIRPVVNPKAFGLTTIADVWLEVESDLIQEVAQRVTQFENVSYVACSIGESDVSIQVLARDTSEVYKFVTEVIRKIPGVRKTTTAIVPVILKDVYEWNMPTSINKK
jgi:Lrp/AsnC family transcriptional regulator for asnA, asnC and gidA